MTADRWSIIQVIKNTPKFVMTVRKGLGSMILKQDLNIMVDQKHFLILKFENDFKFTSEYKKH